jgi:hypothetical protein
MPMNYMAVATTATGAYLLNVEFAKTVCPTTSGRTPAVLTASQGEGQPGAFQRGCATEQCQSVAARRTLSI